MKFQIGDKVQNIAKPQFVYEFVGEDNEIGNLFRLRALEKGKYKIILLVNKNTLNNNYKLLKEFNHPYTSIFK